MEELTSFERTSGQLANVPCDGRRKDWTEQQRIEWRPGVAGGGDQMADHHQLGRRGSNNKSRSVKEEGHGTNIQGAIQNWPTVQAHDARGGSLKRTQRGSSAGGCKNLADEITLWPTVTVHGNNNRKGMSPNSGDGLATTAQTAFGLIESSTNAPSRGQLNPDFCEWLMNWPIRWTSAERLSQQEWNGWMNNKPWTDAVILMFDDGKKRAVRPGICGLSNKVPDRLERISAIGDGQVPAVVAAMWQILSEGINQ